ncbi:MAG: pitrilysin family protein [Trueperaceae bacterium]|nr:pitrilysin family protein [Trueperaceae bacterium]
MRAGGPPSPRTHRLDNGLRVAVQPLPGVATVAARLLLPLGAAHDPPELPGLSALAWAWAERGAAGRDAHAHADAWAELGARPGGHAGREVSVRAFTATPDVLIPALRLLAAEAAAPTLANETFALARTQAQDELDALSDRPDAQLDEALNAHAFRPPYDRSAYGNDEGLAAADAEAVRRGYLQRARPDGAVLAVAGGMPEAAAWAAVEATFGGWTAPADPASGLPDLAWAPPAGHDLVGGGQQAHLGWAWPVLPPGDPRAAAQALGMAVLSAGSGARLFREVREARGLAYAVEAGTHTLAGTGWASAYAATGPERAEEAMSVIERILDELPDGVDEEELSRARAGLRTREALTAETSAGRAAQAARDVWLLGRARSLRARDESLMEPTAEDVRAALAAWPERPPTRVALWPERAPARAGEAA